MNKFRIAVCLALAAWFVVACSREDRADVRKKSAAGASWPIFRGDPSLSGRSGDAPPEKPVLLWSFKTGSAVVSSPVVGGGQVFVGSTDGKVYAVALKDGRKTWEFDTKDDVEASPLLLDGSIYVGSLSGIFYCLDARTGRPRWTYDIKNSIYGSANWIRPPGSPGTLVFVGSYDSRMYCFEAATGLLKWTYATDNYINGTPATDGENLVFGGCDERLHILSVRDGQKKGEVWAGSYIPGSAAIAGGKAYVGHYGNQLVSIDLETQKIAWTYGDRDKGGAFFSSPAVGEDRVIIGSRDRSLHCVSRQTGAGIWTFEARDEIDSSPVIAGTRVVVGSTDGRLYILNLADGKKIWSYEIGGALIGSPAVAGGFIIIGSEDGRLYAFGETP